MLSRLCRRLPVAGARQLSASSAHLAKPPLGPDYDATGRTPGFARRISPPASSIRLSRNSNQARPTTDTPDAAKPSVSSALQQSAQNDTNKLLAPVHIPEDPHSVLRSDHPALQILDNSSIVVHRQIEMMNLMLGFEQANKYVINDAHGNVIGFLAEQEHGMGNAIARQAFRTHRSFTTHVFDVNQREVLRFHRPFSYISSRIKIFDALSGSDLAYKDSDALSGTSTGPGQTAAQISMSPLSDLRVIGEVQQQWAPLRRKYNLFLHRQLADDPSDPNAPRLTSGDLPLSNSKALQVAENASENVEFAQFAYVDEPFLSWDFSLKSADDRLIGSVNRNFAGFGREIFTDTGVYALRMDSAGLAAEARHIISQTGKSERVDPKSEDVRGMTLDQRAIMLATAVNVDFDYFSRQRGGVAGGGMWPFWIPMGGGGAEGAGAGAGAGEAGIAGSEAGTGVIGETTTEGAGGAVAGAGAMAGYEAMRGRQEAPMDDPASPQSPSAGEDFWGGYPPSGGSSGDGNDHGSNDGSHGGGDDGGAGGGGDGGGGGGDWGDFGDLF